MPPKNLPPPSEVPLLQVSRYQQKVYILRKERHTDTQTDLHRSDAEHQAASPLHLPNLTLGEKVEQT